MDIRETRIHAELYDITRELLDDGFTVYYLPQSGTRLTRWIVFGKADDTGTVNTGTVEVAYFGGLDVSASIKPSREYGSSMAMWVSNKNQNYQPYDSVLNACRAAAQPKVRNFLNVTLANDGLKHFDWCHDRLVRVGGGPMVKLFLLSGGIYLSQHIVENSSDWSTVINGLITDLFGTEAAETRQDVHETDYPTRSWTGLIQGRMYTVKEVN